MSHHARARSFRIVSGALIAAGALVIAGSSAVRRDELFLRESSPRGIPLHLLSDSSVVDAYRSIGYVSALTSQQPLHTLFCGMLDRELGPTHAFLRRELDRFDRLTAEAFNSPPTGGFYDAVLRSDETRRLYYEVAVRQWRCMDLLYGPGPPSPELPRMIEENIRDLERLGLGEWTGYDYECLAAYRQSTGRYEEALEYWRRALAIYAARGDLPLASQSANKIGRQLLRMGDWEAAERYIIESLGHADAAGDRMFASRALYALALLRGSQGYYAEAESLLIRSIERIGSIADPTTELSELVGLADLYCGFGEYSRAGYLVERAVLQTELNLADPAVASDKNLRFNLKQHLSEAVAIQAAIMLERRAYDGAVETIRRGVEMARETRDDRLLARLLTMRGDANAARSRSKEAARDYARAIKIARRMRDRPGETRAWCALAELHVGAARFEEAEACLARALDLNAGRECWKEEAEMFRLLAGAKAGLGDYRSARELCSKALGIVQEYRAGGGYDAGGRASRVLVDSICAGLVLFESEELRDCDSLSVAAEKARILRSGRSAGPLPVTDEALRRCIERRDWIPANALVIQHVVTPAKTIVIAMDGSTAECRYIPVSSGDLARRVAAFADAARAGADAAAALRAGHELFRILLEPVSHLIEGKNVLCFVPDEALTGLPFGALVVSGIGSRFLIEDTSVLCSPGLLALQEAGVRAAAARSLDADSPKRTVLIGQPEISSLLGRLYPELTSIPHAGGEIAGLRRYVPDADELVGRAATETAVLEALGRSRLVHVATHGVRYPVYGGSAALLLSPPTGAPDGKNVGESLLTEGEIAALDLSGAELVFVSACESAVGGERELGYGVGGAFFEAGAKSVVATLWPVEDAAAEGFAGDFYRALLRERRGSLEALRRAAADMIAEDRAAGNPARRIGVWGPYILLGSLVSSAAF